MRNKITVVGGGNVGASAAINLAMKELGDVVLVDVVEGVPQGKGLDMAQMGPIEGYDVRLIGANDYAPTANSDVVVMTATIPPRPTLGTLHMIEIPDRSTRNGCSLPVRSGLEPRGSLMPSSAMKPPRATKATEYHSVIYAPWRGTE